MPGTVQQPQPRVQALQRGDNNGSIPGIHGPAQGHGAAQEKPNKIPGHDVCQQRPSQRSFIPFSAHQNPDPAEPPLQNSSFPAARARPRPCPRSPPGARRLPWLSSKLIAEPAVSAGAAGIDRGLLQC